MSTNGAAAAPGNPQAPEVTGDILDLHYEFAIHYFKLAENRAQIDYDATSTLMALHKQATKGKFNAAVEPALGWFDFVGHDRRAAWEELGDMTKAEAKFEFVSLIGNSCEGFASWLEHKVMEHREKERKLEEERQERIRVAQEQERLRQLEEQRARLEEEQRRLAAAQANMHAHQHTPDRVMPSTPGQYASPQRTIPNSPMTPNTATTVQQKAAELEQFRQDLRDKSDYTLQIGRGEVVRVRVPNKQPGKTMVLWKFCTEANDIGFGVDFEVTTEGEPVVENIVPVERKPCDTELLIGSHSYPKPGNWLLLFDNSFSILRSKTVYYKCELM
eukprot:m.16438 g.16438  ORF g.16438 m.16438 type:complete len:331 (+) comp5699_c0_seq2:241-1233(+)